MIKYFQNKMNMFALPHREHVRVCPRMSVCAVHQVRKNVRLCASYLSLTGLGSIRVSKRWGQAAIAIDFISASLISSGLFPSCQNKPESFQESRWPKTARQPECVHDASNLWSTHTRTAEANTFSCTDISTTAPYVERSSRRGLNCDSGELLRERSLP